MAWGKLVHNRQAIVSVRMSQIFVGTLSLVYLWKGEVPWEVLVTEQIEQQVGGHALYATQDASAPRQLRAAPEEVNVPLQLYSSDTHEEKNSFSEALMSMVAGFLCFAMSVLILWRNEGHAVRLAQLFDLARRRIKSVTEAKEDNLREFVSVAGNAETQDELRIEKYDVIAPPNSAKLRAKVWMYQWVEHKKEKDNSTEYTYKTEWVAHQVNSTNFRHTAGHENPQCELDMFTRQLASVQLSGFKLPQRVLGQLQKWAPISVSEEWIDEFTQKHLPTYSRGLKSTHKETDGLKRERLPVLEFAKGSSDHVGDIRLSLEYVPCGPLTVTGVQVQQGEEWTFVPLQFVEHASLLPSLQRGSTMTTNIGDSKHQTLLGESEGDFFEDEARNTMDHLKRGIGALMKGFPSPVKMTDLFFEAAARDEILFAVEEKVGPATTLRMAAAWEARLTSTIRLFGVVLMYVSIMAIFKPFRWVFAHLWILGSLLNGGLSVLAFFLTCCCSSLTISAAYFVYRPILSVGLIAGAGAFVYMGAQYGKQQQQKVE